MIGDLKIFSGRANLPLAKKIAQELGFNLSSVNIKNFLDGEIKVKIEENVRGADVFVVQPTPPPADNILELLLMLDALRRASADRITAVIPYFGYARQDRKDEPRVPISAKLIANLLTTAGANRVLTMELHAEQIQGFFDIPVDHLYATPVLVEYYRRQENLDNLVVVAPDVGRANRARGFAKRLGENIAMAVIDKRRPAPDLSEIITVIGDVESKDCLIFDDIIDTGRTVLKACESLKKMKARRVLVCATHPVFSDNALEKLLASPIEQIVVTDTIERKTGSDNNKVAVLSIAPLLAEAILRIHKGQSVYSLFI